MGNSQKKVISEESNILDEFGVRLAQRIRDERLARAWSLDEMAKQSGISRAMVHRIESGRSSPTATLLGKISGAFQISMSMLLRNSSSKTKSRLVRAAKRPQWQDPDTGYIREQISSLKGNDKQGQLGPQITRVTLPPKATISFPSSAFEFLSQSIWVLEGTLHFTEGKKIHKIGKDDCLTLGRPSPCTFENRSDAPCTYVVVVT